MTYYNPYTGKMPDGAISTLGELEAIVWQVNKTGNEAVLHTVGQIGSIGTQILVQETRVRKDGDPQYPSLVVSVSPVFYPAKHGDTTRRGVRFQRTILYPESFGIEKRQSEHRLFAEYEAALAYSNTLKANTLYIESVKSWWEKCRLEREHMPQPTSFRWQR